MFGFVTQNVQGLPRMSPAQTQHDVALTGSQGDIICWQEINSKVARDAVRSLPDIWDHFLPNKINGNLGGSPISWKMTLFKRIDSGKIQIAKGFPGISSDRYLVWVILEDLVTKIQFVVINTHFVAGAWSKKLQRFRKRRQRKWLAGQKLLIEMLEDFINAGFIIFLSGDFNRWGSRPVGSADLSRRIGYLTPLKSLDQIAVISTLNVVVSSSAAVELRGRFSDHQGRGITFAFRRRP